MSESEEIALLESALRKALHGSTAERIEAENVLIQRELRRIRSENFFNVAADICRGPFRKPPFP